MKTALISLTLWIGLGLQNYSFAAGNSETFKPLPLTPTELEESTKIISEIKRSNPPQKGILKTRFGLIQILNNTPSIPSDLDISDGTFPAAGFEGVFNFVRSLGLETHYLYAQNFMKSTNSSAKVDFMNVGPRYTYYLDETRLNDYFAARLFYHRSTSNIGKPDKYFMNSYTGWALSVERSIPASRTMGVVASLDIIQITSASFSAPDVQVAANGVGYMIRGESFYQVDWFGPPARLGLAYTQQSYSNSFGSGSRDDRNRSAYFQLIRGIWGSVSILF